MTNEDLPSCFRLTEADRTMLDDLREAMGVAPSGVIPVVLRDRRRWIFAMKPPAQARRKRWR